MKTDLPYCQFGLEHPRRRYRAPPRPRRTIATTRPAGRRTLHAGSQTVDPASSRALGTARRSSSPRSGTRIATTRPRRTGRRARRASRSYGPGAPAEPGRRLPAALPGAVHRRRRRRTAPRRTTTTRPTRTRRSSRPTATAPASLGEFTQDTLREVRLDSQNRDLQDQQHAAVRPGAGHADPAVAVRQPDGHGVRARRHALPAHLRRRLLRHQPGRRR